ncbi:MAG: serine/threonine protein kinase [Marmoricola sp.]|nr:serine/threonine protein kinase [Marmoricola sp.]
MYGDYAILNVPVPGKAREAGWIYRPRSGFTRFGPVHAVFSGTQTIDSTQLDVPALVRNLAQARATLKVEEPAQSYVVLRSISHVGDAPQVYVYLTNKFSESGYLMTTLDGTVQKAYPFGQ